MRRLNRLNYRNSYVVDTKGEGVPLIQSHYLRIPTRAVGVL